MEMMRAVMMENVKDILRWVIAFAVVVFLIPVPADAKAGKALFTDGALKPATEFDSVFPYLTTPTPGSR